MSLISEKEKMGKKCSHFHHYSLVKLRFCWSLRDGLLYGT